MHEVIAKMISKYECRGLNDYVNALREILQEVEPFVKRPENLSLWSREFFLDVASRIQFV